MGKITRERVLGELAAIAFARISDFYDWNEGKPELKKRLSPGARAAVAAIEPGTHGLKLKLYDKLKALELLGKCLGIFAGEPPEKEESNLLEAILQATEREVQTCDIPELQQAAAAGHELVEQAESTAF